MELVNNKYMIDGIPALELAKKYGTPIYIYETAKIKSQYERLKKAFSACDVRINYACKALTNVNILKYMHSLGSGLDAVSIEEVQLGMMAGFKPQEIMYTPNCVSMDELQQAVKAGVKVNIDSISVLEQFGHIYGSTVPVFIRINPHIMAGGHDKISTGHIDSKFGISIYQMPHVHRVIEANKMNVEGLHMHTGSDILDMDVFMQGAEIIFNTAKQFKGLKFIDFGSGFKVPYKPDDYATDIEALGKMLSKKFNEFCKEYGRKLTLIFEPGKFIVSEAGHFLVRVNVIKHTTSAVFAGVDSGFNHLIRPMFYDSYHHILNISKPGKSPRVYSVVGYICETDTFAWDRKIQEIAEGDILCFANAGAYCYSMSSNYNSRLRPAEVLIHLGKDYLISKKENIGDIIKNQVIYDISSTDKDLVASHNS